jgi:SpoVK/Ycf46/Vps4 family AAA+-type ATPase
MPDRQPYASNLDYLAAGIDYLWHLAKSRPPARLGRRRPPDCDDDRVRYRTTADDKAAEFAARTSATLELGEVDLPLESLVATHDLDDFEKHVLLLALAPTVDPQFDVALEELCACHCMEVRSVLQILCDDLQHKVRARCYFTCHGALISNGLLNLSFRRHASTDNEFMRIDVELPRRISSLILDSPDVDEQLITFSSVIDPEVDLASVVLPDGDKAAALEQVRRHADFCQRRAEWGFDDILSYGKGIVMLFAGPPGVGKTMLAHALAKEVDKRLMLVDIRKLIEHSDATFEENLLRVFHEARLQNAIILFDEADEMFGDRGYNGAMPTLLREFERLDGIAILATNRGQLLDEALERRILFKLDFDIPTPELREQIWRIHLPDAAPIATDIDLALLAEEFEFSGGYIKNAVLVAVNRALSRDGDPEITHADLRYGAITQRRNRLARHTDRVIPKVQLADVIADSATTDKLRQVVGAARNAPCIFRSWGFAAKSANGRGISVLLSGASGLGKTLAAEAIAGELGRNLYPVNLAALVSKYVGETEKNLDEIFNAAADSESVLFFDEADSLFATRLDSGSQSAHYINQQINCLLTLMERFAGVVILATNRPDAMDAAFARRLRYHIRFEPPDTPTRERLWRALLPAEAPLAADLRLDELASRYALTGGQIRQATLCAAFAAAADGSSITFERLSAAASEQLPLAPERPPISFFSAVTHG